MTDQRETEPESSTDGLKRPPEEASAFWVTERGLGELRQEPSPDPVPGDALVRTLYSGISRWTESLVFRGEVPQSEYQAMRAPFQGGDFSGPVKYRYCSVGVVEEGPEHLLGRTVFCPHPHQTRYRVPADLDERSSWTNEVES